MKALLLADIMTLSKAIDDDREPFIQLKKELEIQFTPFVGLNLQFVGLRDNPANSNLIPHLSHEPTEIATGIFRIEKVYYEVDNQQFVFRAEEIYESIDIVYSIAEQLILGYGFEPTR